MDTQQTQWAEALKRAKQRTASSQVDLEEQEAQIQGQLQELQIKLTRALEKKDQGLAEDLFFDVVEQRADLAALELKAIAQDRDVTDAITKKVATRFMADCLLLAGKIDRIFGITHE